MPAEPLNWDDEDDEVQLTEDDLPHVEDDEGESEDIDAYVDRRAAERAARATPNRRRGPDELTKAPDWLSAVGWGLAIVSLLMFGLAKPEQVNMFDRFMAVGRGPARWDPLLLRGALALNVLAVLSGVVAMALNLARLRREGDRLRLAPIVLLLLCAGGLIAIGGKL